MKFRQLLVVFPLALLGSCAAKPLLLTCGDLSGHVYTGQMKNAAGVVLDTVTIFLTDQSHPGFKHNVLMVPPPPPPPPTSPQYDAECADGTPVVLNIYTPNTQPPLALRLASWAVLAPVAPNSAFHLHDAGSTLFPSGADGDFTQQ